MVHCWRRDISCTIYRYRKVLYEVSTVLLVLDGMGLTQKTLILSIIFRILTFRFDQEPTCWVFLIKGVFYIYQDMIETGICTHSGMMIFIHRKTQELNMITMYHVLKKIRDVMLVWFEGVQEKGRV